jgi:hypothetical protein
MPSTALLIVMDPEGLVTGVVPVANGTFIKVP